MAKFEPVFADLVRVFTTSEGTGPIVPGGPVAGHRTFASALSTGDQFYYSIEAVSGGAAWEVGRGTLESDGRIGRVPLASSAGGALVPFAAGTKTVALTVAAEWYGREQAGAEGLAQLSGAEFTGHVSAPTLALDEPLPMMSGGTGAASAAAARAALGLAIGSDVQAQDARLSAIAGVASTADTVPYFTGAAGAAVTSLTPYARSVLAVGDAAAARSQLGLGSASVQSAANVAITGGSIAGVALSLSSALALTEGGTGARSAAAARASLGVSASGGDTAYALRANNLSDLGSASAARTSLGLGTAAVKDTGQSGDALPVCNGPAVSWAAGANFGNSSPTATASPISINLGGSYSSTAGRNLKVRLFDDGVTVVGIGVSADQLDYAANATGRHAFWLGTSRIGSFGSGGVEIGTATSTPTASPIGVNLGGTFADTAGSSAKAKVKLYDDGAGVVGGIGISLGQIDYTAWIGANHSFYVGGTKAATIGSSGVDVAGELRGDSLRLDATPAAGSATATHKLAVSLNGTTYYLLLSNA